MAIIALSGYAKSGKDTVAEIIKELQPNKWEIKKFSGKLKQVASILTGIPQDMFEEQDFKNSKLNNSWDVGFEVVNESGQMSIDSTPILVREFLQILGTEAVRDNLHPNAWVNALMSNYKLIDYNDDEQPEYPNWIITDCRFHNEAIAIKDNGGVVVRIDRTGTSPVNAHESETALDNWNFDYKIANVSDLVALRQSVEVLLNKIS